MMPADLPSVTARQGRLKANDGYTSYRFVDAECVELVAMTCDIQLNRDEVMELAQMFSSAPPAAAAILQPRGTLPESIGPPLTQVQMDALEARIAVAVAAERERCAKIADAVAEASTCYYCEAAKDIAAKIRSGDGSQDHEVGELTDANATTIGKRTSAHDPSTCWWCQHREAVEPRVTIHHGPPKDRDETARRAHIEYVANPNADSLTERGGGME